MADFPMEARGGAGDDDGGLGAEWTTAGFEFIRQGATTPVRPSIVTQEGGWFQLPGFAGWKGGGGDDAEESG